MSHCILKCKQGIYVTLYLANRDGVMLYLANMSHLYMYSRSDCMLKVNREIMSHCILQIGVPYVNRHNMSHCIFQIGTVSHCFLQIGVPYVNMSHCILKYKQGIVHVFKVTLHLRCKQRTCSLFYVNQMQTGNIRICKQGGYVTYIYIYTQITLNTYIYTYIYAYM